MSTHAELVFVLGMHRSGTSVLTRALPLFKFNIGNQHLARFDNPKGFFEDATFVKINTDLMARAGLIWDSPKELPVKELACALKSPMAQAAYKWLEAKLQVSPSLGLKDPRCSRLLPFWQPIVQQLGCKLRCVLSLRHPLSVAASLAARDGMSMHVALRLYTIYLKDALASLRNLPVLFVHYDALLRDPESQLERLGAFLHRSPDRQALAAFVSEFLEQGLCHHKAHNAPQDMSHQLHLALELYTQLLEAATLPPLALEEGFK